MALAKPLPFIQVTTKGGNKNLGKEGGYKQETFIPVDWSKYIVLQVNHKIEQNFTLQFQTLTAFNGILVGCLLPNHYINCPYFDIQYIENSNLDVVKVNEILDSIAVNKGLVVINPTDYKGDANTCLLELATLLEGYLWKNVEIFVEVKQGIKLPTEFVTYIEDAKKTNNTDKSPVPKFNCQLLDVEFLERYNLNIKAIDPNSPDLAVPPGVLTELPKFKPDLVLPEFGTNKKSGGYGNSVTINNQTELEKLEQRLAFWLNANMPGKVKTIANNLEINPLQALTLIAGFNIGVIHSNRKLPSHLEESETFISGVYVLDDDDNDDKIYSPNLFSNLLEWYGLSPKSFEGNVPTLMLDWMKNPTVEPDEYLLENIKLLNTIAGFKVKNVSLATSAKATPIFRAFLDNGFTDFASPDDVLKASVDSLATLVKELNMV